MTIAELDVKIADRYAKLDQISGMVDGSEAGRSVNFSAMRKSLQEEIAFFEQQKSQLSATAEGPAEWYGVAVG